VHGPQDTHEYEAATVLKDRILASWPQVANDPSSEIHLIASVKCHGQNPRDVDVLVLAEFNSPPSYRQYLPVETTGGPPFQGVNNVWVDNLCFVVEVKDHPADRVRFTGGEGVTVVEVLYNDSWHNVTEQAFKQQFSVRNVFRNARLEPVPWVSNLIWLRNIDHLEIGQVNNVIGSNFPWELVLNKIGVSHPPKFYRNAWHLSAVRDDMGVMNQALKHFTKVLEPTNLDRRRLELVTEKRLDDQIANMMDQIDNQVIMLQGWAGTGKTIRLLHLGYRLAVERGASVLVLTYNRALVSDIRRMLSFTGLGDDVGGERVEIDTVHSVMHSLVKAIGINVEEDAFFEKYDDYKNEALELLSEVATEDDYAQLVGSTMPWDYILIDEGQDWPQNELELIMKVRGHRGLVIANGVSQLVRQPFPADWAAAIPTKNRIVLQLDKCLRMKANLIRFVTSLADELAIRSRWSSEEAIDGGRVVILDGDYGNRKDLHGSLIDQIANDGQQPLDMLFCVPPSTVDADSEGSRVSILGKTLESWGFEIWDGVSLDTRRSYPTSVNQCRIVQYDSCRGLEGWTAINLRLDEFYDYKMEEFRLSNDATQKAQGAEEPEGAGYEQGQAYAARWLMIPLTRAIDTLVITLEQPDSPIRNALKVVAEKHADFVTWYSH